MVREVGGGGGPTEQKLLSAVLPKTISGLQLEETSNNNITNGLSVEGLTLWIGPLLTCCGSCR